MTKRTSAILLPIIVIALVAIVAFARNEGKQVKYFTNSGLVFGTSYNIKYEYTEDVKGAIDSTLSEVDKSLSPFNKESIITAVNNNKDVMLNKYFTDVFMLAQKVSQETDGAFDVTVAPLVNVWGFGFKHGKFPDQNDIDSIKAFVGYKKVALENGKIVKNDQRVMLDCSAIAKGFGVDKVAEMLESKGIKNFLVEIGGEIVAKGMNPDGKKWKIGVTKPDDDSLSVKENLQTILELSDIAMATSGDYRNFYIKDGKKYAHTINPKTGYPAEQNILSATVIIDLPAKSKVGDAFESTTCAKADALATSFMTMGLDKAKAFVESPKGKGLRVYFIYHSPKDGKYAIWSKGL